MLYVWKNHFVHCCKRAWLKMYNEICKQFSRQNRTKMHFVIIYVHFVSTQVRILGAWIQGTWELAVSLAAVAEWNTENRSLRISTITYTNTMVTTVKLCKSYVKHEPNKNWCCIALCLCCPVSLKFQLRLPFVSHNVKVHTLLSSKGWARLHPYWRNQ